MKSWAEQDLSKYPIKIIIKKERETDSLTDTDRERDRLRIKLSSLCKPGRFSYGVSPRTPPLEGTSLHRRNNSVERPWGILSLFTTCLPSCVKITLSESVSHYTYTGLNSMHSQKREKHSSGAVWESRWTSWAVRPNEPSGFRGRKDLLHRAPALVTTCP